MSQTEKIYHRDRIFSPQGASACDLIHVTKFEFLFLLLQNIGSVLKKVGQKK